LQEYPALPEDQVTRYIYSSSNFSITKKRVKHGAFNLDADQPQDFSVDLITDLADQEVWDYQSESYEGVRKVQARGDLKVGDITQVKGGNNNFLNVFVNGKPHKRHANIRSSPIAVAHDRAIATELADRASLHLKP